MNEIYGLLEQHWFFEMKKGKVLSVLPDGTSWAWLIKEDNCFIWDGDCIFGYDFSCSSCCMMQLGISF